MKSLKALPYQHVLVFSRILELNTITYAISIKLVLIIFNIDKEIIV